jgi:SOS response regulatory protein OraA/RecX
MDELTNSDLRMLNVTPLAAAYVIRQIEADHTVAGIQESLKEIGLDEEAIRAVFSEASEHECAERRGPSASPCRN